MDRGAWRATVHGVTKGWTQLSNWAVSLFLSLQPTSLRRELFMARVLSYKSVMFFSISYLQQAWAHICSSSAPSRQLPHLETCGLQCEAKTDLFDLVNDNSEPSPGPESQVSHGSLQQKIPLLHLGPWTSALWFSFWPVLSNQSILQEINSEYSLEGLMLKLKLQSFGHLMRRANSFENTLMLGKIEGRRRRGRQGMRWLDGITDSMDMSLSKLREMWRTGKAGMLESTGSQSQTWLSCWTTIAWPDSAKPRGWGWQAREDLTSLPKWTGPPDLGEGGSSRTDASHPSPHPHPHPYHTDDKPHSQREWVICTFKRAGFCSGSL